MTVSKFYRPLRYHGPQAWLVWLVQAPYLTKASNYTLLTLVHFPDRTNYL